MSSHYYVTFVTHEGRFVRGPVLGAVSVIRAAVRCQVTAQCVPASCVLAVISQYGVTVLTSLVIQNKECDGPDMRHV